MPELPEVESLRRGLVPYLKGNKIVSVKVLRSKLVSGRGTVREALDFKRAEFEAVFVDDEILNIERRAKNLIFEFKSGKVLLVHLKMTGQLVYKSKENKIVKGGHPIQDSDLNLPNKHTYVIFELKNGFLYYNDVRMFGYLLYYPDKLLLETEGHFDGLGLEPESPDFTQEYFVGAMQNKSGKLKTLFLNQDVVVGLGNIYCDEVCFEAGVRPDRAVKTLTTVELKKLYKAIVKIIPMAIDMGGSSVANYLLADGSKGNYAHYHKVYLKGGKPCQICGSELQKFKLNSRTTVYCSKCQK
jgi:formamidopyrimidine-DNA glycosylase